MNAGYERVSQGTYGADEWGDSAVVAGPIDVLDPAGSSVPLSVATPTGGVSAGVVLRTWTLSTATSGGGCVASARV
jgi:hypothetical protein